MRAAPDNTLSVSSAAAYTHTAATKRATHQLSPREYPVGFDALFGRVVRRVGTPVRVLSMDFFPRFYA